MYVVRNVFTAKPGRGKELVDRFKRAAPHFEGKGGVRSTRILTDIAAEYWTVVVESEVDDLGAYFARTRSATSEPEVGAIMAGYLDAVAGGHREIFLIE